MTLKWDPKDPDEELDYTIDWTRRLVTGDTISTSTWIIDGPDSDLTQTFDSISTVYTIVWLSGGTVGYRYTCTNRVVTSQGRTMDQSVTLRIKEK